MIKNRKRMKPALASKGLNEKIRISFILSYFSWHEYTIIAMVIYISFKSFKKILQCISKRTTSTLFMNGVCNDISTRHAV